MVRRRGADPVRVRAETHLRSSPHRSRPSSPARGGEEFLPARLLSPRAHESCLVALPVAFGDGGALVGLLAALGDAERHLGAAALAEVDVERHERDPLARDRAGEVAQFFLFQEQLARRARLEARQNAALVFRDVGVEEPHFALALARPGIAERGAAEAEALHLRPLQHEPGLYRPLDRVIEAGLAILGGNAVRDQAFLLGIEHDTLSPNLPGFETRPALSWRGAERQSHPGEPRGAATLDRHAATARRPAMTMSAAFHL